MRQVLPYFCSLPWSQQVRPVSIPVLIIPWRQELEPNYWLVCNAPAPVVWIGGSEPLLHPEMGQLTRCIAAIGRDVFLETDGALLRRRIHEFRPVSRLFLTIQWNGLERWHDVRAGRAGAFQAALDGMRVAR